MFRLYFHVSQDLSTAPVLRKSNFKKERMHVSPFVCVCMSEIHMTKYVKLFDSKLPCTPATDMTTVTLNKPQIVFSTKK